MSVEEMETTWNAQHATASPAAAGDWIDRSRRSFRRHTLLLLVAILGNGLGLGLQIHRIATVSGRTLSNSTWEVLIPALTLVICLGGAWLLRRAHRRYRALMHHTRRCLELILREKRIESVAHTRWIPYAYAFFFVLIILSKLQSIDAGFESPGNAWSGVWMAAALFFIISAFLFHRAKTFLQPEITELEQTLESLATD